MGRYLLLRRVIDDINVNEIIFVARMMDGEGPRLARLMVLFDVGLRYIVFVKSASCDYQN